MIHQSKETNTKSAHTRKRARVYTSPLRAEQAEQTRLRIVQAYGDEICACENGDVTVQQVAARAGVSVPTLYRNFTNLDELGDAFWAWIEPQFGVLAEVKTADDLPAFVEGLHRQFGARAPLIRAMALTAPGRRLRMRTLPRRNQMVQNVLAPLTKQMQERDARAVAAVCKVLGSGQVWQMMHEEWGLDSEETARAAAWAVRALIDSLRKNPNPLKQEKGS